MKKRTYTFLSFAAMLLGCSVPKPEYSSINDYPIPMEQINEFTYAAEKSSFMLWSPNADSVILRIYAEGEGGEPLKTLKMKRQPEGLWKAVVKEDLKGRFYTFSIQEDGKWRAECPGIFAKAVGINGHRAAIIDMKQTNPAGWENDKSPEMKSVADAIIYEMHWRDFTADPSSGLKNLGKYLSMT